MDVAVELRQNYVYITAGNHPAMEYSFVINRESLRADGDVEVTNPDGLWELVFKRNRLHWVLRPFSAHEDALDEIRKIGPDPLTYLQDCRAWRTMSEALGRALEGCIEPDIRI